MKTINLSKGLVAFVDDEDYPFLSTLSWCAHKSNRVYYARSPKGCFMHRLIMGAEIDEEVDHIDSNGLNNQKHNLRKCTRQQNAARRRVKSTKKYTSYKGIYMNPTTGRWQAIIQQNNKRVYTRSFSDEHEAAHAYNEKAKMLFGEFALLNEIPVQTNLLH